MPEFTFTVGQVVGAASCRYEKKQTRRPDRFTDSSLIDAMLHADRYAKSDADRAILRQTEGLGTSRTRSPTIDSLVRKEYLTIQKRGRRNELVSTRLARLVCAQLPQYLVDVATTAKWEVAFDLIEKGRATPEQLRMKVEELVRNVIESASNATESLSGLSRGADRVAKSGAARSAGARTVS